MSTTVSSPFPPRRRLDLLLEIGCCILLATIVLAAIPFAVVMMIAIYVGDLVERAFRKKTAAR